MIAIRGKKEYNKNRRPDSNSTGTNDVENSWPEVKVKAMRLFFEIIIILVGIILGIEAFYPDTIFSEGRAYAFLNSNFFSALIIFIVGVFAIGLYIRQKRDYKRDAAKLILQEIRYAEQRIRGARETGSSYPLANKLLPTNNWNNNMHLFIKDLKDTEIDLISKFYSNAAYLDNLISKISDLRNQNYSLLKFDIKHFVLPGVELPEQQLQQHSPEENNLEQQLEQQISPEKQTFGQSSVLSQRQLLKERQEIKGEDNATNKLLENVSKEIEFIYNTPIVNKLRDISEKKWH